MIDRVSFREKKTELVRKKGRNNRFVHDRLDSFRMSRIILGTRIVKSG